MNTLGENIRILRKANEDEKQNEVAGKIGITQQALSKIEKGSEPSLDTLKHIAKYYNVSIKDLVESDLKDYKVALTNEFYNVMFPIVASEEALKDDEPNRTRL